MYTSRRFIHKHIYTHTKYSSVHTIYTHTSKRSMHVQVIDSHTEAERL